MQNSIFACPGFPQETMLHRGKERPYEILQIAHAFTIPRLIIHDNQISSTAYLLYKLFATN